MISGMADYSLKLFFSDDDSTFHILPNEDNNLSDICLIITRNQSQNRYHFFYVKPFIEGLINQNDLHSLDSFLQNIGKQYIIGTDFFDLSDKELKDCLKTNGYESWVLEEGEKRHHGKYGTVFKFFKKGQDDQLVIKVYTRNWPIFRNKGREQRISEKLSEKGIGPRVFHTWTCSFTIATEFTRQPLAFIVMERYDKTLFDYLKELNDKATEFIKTWDRTSTFESIAQYIKDDIKVVALATKNKLIEMKEINFLHNDLHAANIMLKFKQNEKLDKLCIIDFGFSEFVSPKNFQMEYDYRLLSKSLYKIRIFVSLVFENFLELARPDYVKKIISE